MAVEVDLEKLALFEQLFATPTIEEMVALSPDDFEQFVAHVFTCAGYVVENVARHRFPYGTGVDLNLHVGKIGPTPGARVEVRRYDPTYTHTFNDLAAFVGKLKLAGNIPGYFVTTSSFNRNAQKAAASSESNTDLIDGARLLRYITYVGGSRINGTYAGSPVAPSQPIAPNWLMTGDELAITTARPPRQSRVLALANNKGGVAKTTSALNIGLDLAETHHQRVLLVDLDGQASLTRSAPPPGAKNQPLPPETATLLDYFRGLRPLQDIIRPTRFSNVWLLPAHPDLHHLDSGGIGRPRAELRFVEDLRQASMHVPGEQSSPFDWVIVDTPPAQTFFTRVAILAADQVLIPAFAEQYAVAGLRRVLETIRTMDALTSDTDHWLDRVRGCFVTRWKPSATATAAKNALANDLSAEGIVLLRSNIPTDERIEKAHKETIGGSLRDLFHLPGQPGAAALAYHELVKELI